MPRLALLQMTTVRAGGGLRVPTGGGWPSTVLRTVR